ncbi:multifunctional 2',3'-cyclic-nucleotide 2'-phosphodiesterase/5'-nucleotidase/3'-nucleotidase [Clostridium beijerinckii]|nr:multifunctional 2',3'-cyclic-nucleotide 2'-phosphodiesterase/5'-nucleotidase/3'-nucleotidase [Clostridium beijerinckii]
MLKQKNKKILSALLVFTFMLSNFVMFGQIKIAKADTISISNSSVNVTTGSAVTVTTGAAVTLDIVEITDFHGQLLDTSNTYHVGAALAKAVEDVNDENPGNTLVIGGGDLYQGTPVSNMLHGVPVQQVLSKMGMEVTTLGNHEFDWGLNTINNETMKGAGYEIVCSNLYDKSTNKPLYKPYKIVEKGGVKIAVIGAILKDVATIVLPANMKDYTVTDPATEINKCAKEIRDNNEADVVLSVVHDGKESLKNIVSNLHGVDAVFGGHTHSNDDVVLQDKDDNNIPTLTAYSSGKGFMDLKISLDENKKIIGFSQQGKNWNGLPQVTADTSVDKECKDLVARAYSALAPTFNEKIGYDEVAYTRTQTASPYGESQLGNWMSDVVRNNVKADVGIVNNGGIRIDTPAGDITVGTIFSIMPFDNTVTTVKMTGAQLKTIIEQGIVDGGKGLQISGVKIAYDSSKTPYKEAVTDGERVVSMVRESDGTPIKSDDMLTVAAPDFLATGGDAFTRFLDKPIADTYYDTHTLVRDALLADVTANKKINVTMDKRLVNLSKTSAPTMTIKEAKAAAASKASATIEGFVSGVSGKTVFLQDDPTNPTAGIVLYNACGSTVTKGDKITVTGPLSVYNGLIEITLAATSNVSVSSQNNTITPKVVTIKDINDDLQGILIKLKKVTFTSLDESPAIKDSTGTSIIYKMPTVTALKVNDVKDVTAMVSKFNNVQLIVRDASDVVNPSEDSNSTISIVATSDVHGAAFDWDYGTNSTTGKGGLAKVSTYVNNLRASNPNVMLIDNGDTMQGTPLVYYYNMKDKTSVYPMAKVMGAMKYDTWTLGNHEFNFGLDTLNRVKNDYKDQGIKVLAANAYNTDNSNFVEPYYIKDLNANGKIVKVGIVGLTNKCIPSWENPEHYKGLHFNDIVDEATKWVPIVKKAGADVVIVAAHSGEEGASDVIPENQIKALATKVSGIDAIIAGHAHSTINDLTLKNPDGKIVPVLEPNKGASFISQIDINLDSNNAVKAVNIKNVAMDKTIAEDQNIISIMKPYKDATLQYTGTQIGQATDAFPGKDQITSATAIMELINKVQAQYANAQLSIAAPLSTTANIPSGNVTNKDIMGTYVFENYLYGVKMTGEQVKRWLEYSVRYYKQVSNETDKIEKDAQLNIPDYNLDQLYGASYDIDLTKPVGSRIVNLKYNGNLINNTDVFTVAINDYRYNGGGGFMKEAGLSNTDPSIVTYSSAKALGDDGQIRNLMISYIKDAKIINPVCSNNWRLSTKEVVVDNTGSSSSSSNKHKNNISKTDKTQEKASNAEIVTKKVIDTLSTIVGVGVTAETPKQLTNVDGNKLSLTAISKEGKYVGAVVTSEKDSAATTIPVSSTQGKVKAVYKFVPLLGKYIQLTEGVTIGTDAITLPTQANATYYAATVPMAPTETVTQGWAKVSDSWYLVNATGDPKTGWQKDNAGWVYLSPSNGVMQTGWNKQGNTWYHLNESGYMSIGWVKTNDKWYYLNSDGSMASNTTTADGYTLDSNGEWVA